MTRRARAAARSAAIGLALFFAIPLAGQAPPLFPHAAHERLFPVCEGCHRGIVSGVPDETFPDAVQCARCHDGTRAAPVAWSVRAARPTTLRFEHTRHVEAMGRRAEASCENCHAAAGARGRMRVDAARPALCLQCHARNADNHYDGAGDCSLCHLPLAEARALPVERVAALPRPTSHAAAGFLSQHGVDARAGGASCATCHARELCERCHANAARVPAIAALARDPRVATLEAGRAGDWPTPASHARGNWQAAHGREALSAAASCGNCHTRALCSGCHVDARGRTNAALAALPPGRAQGVVPVRSALHPPDFGTRHGRAAASGELQCAQCHSPRQCADCHQASDSRSFHPLNFVERHATDVFARRTDCQSCHSVETFCRACHAQAGLGAGRRDAAFHTSRANWLLAHGQAARSGLEACVACHRQTDCMQCHSAAGGWGVNPHGPGFQAARATRRGGAGCGLCHASAPVRGAEP
jgi:predicted CXXCH cytochrome family protein